MAIYPDSSRHLVVAGGLGDATTWIYDLDDLNDVWRSISDELPLAFGTSVPFADSFLAVGGSHNLNYQSSDQIWQFNADPQDEGFILLGEALKTPKNYVAAFLVPEDYATC